MKYDFGGYATKHNIRCSDGRTIMPDAFKDCDGAIVPLVWHHMHDSVDNVLGHAELENRPDGVYAYCSLNETPAGQTAKEVIQHGDICALSIYANRLQQVGQNVMHGVIREVSLVLAGANPGATIDNLAFAHGDSTEIMEDEAYISFVGDDSILMHEESEKDKKEESGEKTIGDILDTLTEEQLQAVYALIGSISEESEVEKIEHADGEGSEGESSEASESEGEDEADGPTLAESVKSVLSEMSEEEKAATEIIVNSVANGEDIPEEVKAVYNEMSEDQQEAIALLVDAFTEDDEESIEHADEDAKIGDILDSLNDEQKDALAQIMTAYRKGEKTDPSVAKVFETFSEIQKKAAYAMIDSMDKNKSLKHADDETIGDIMETMSEEQQKAVSDIIGSIDKGTKVSEETTKVFNSLTDKQKDAVYAFVGLLLEESEKDDDDEAEHSDYEGDVMKYNIFESDAEGNEMVLEHADIEKIFTDAQRVGSLRDAVLAHGITDIEVLFPEAQAVQAQPYSLTRRMEWVDVVLNGVHKTPFSRIKSTAFNLTEAQARAKGYIKGFKKIEEQITALKRVTTPQTVYKKQGLDRDDIIDITDFDVVAYMKQEMRMMLDEELARAILVGDGRRSADPDKISPEHIRPVWGDDAMYTYHKTIAYSATMDYEALIDEAVRARANYKGSGNPKMFISPTVLTEMRLLKDQDGKYRYESDEKLAQAMRVSAIHEVELFDDVVRTVDGKDAKLAYLILNLADYTVGTNKGGEVNLFDDFDIDFNRQKFLIETRMSGALTAPKSAIVVEYMTNATAEADPVYVKVASPATADIDDYYERDEYGRYIATTDVAVIPGKTYYEVSE